MDQALRRRMTQRLGFVYGPAQAETMMARIEAVIEKYRPLIQARTAASEPWSQADAMLITYADSIVQEGWTPLQTLQGFLHQQVGPRLPWVHLLPFYPWTSDDGFAVTDFRQVNPAVGNWDDVASCAHLPQTHELIKLLRDVYDVAAPSMLLLTETNNPYEDNITYFGQGGDEAQIVYNFTLGPLILHSLVCGDATILSAWAGQVRPMGARATYLNITATHDGIGMQPTEGILSEPQRQRLVDLAYAHQGQMSGKRNSDGSVSPYELNISYFDAVNDPLADEPIETQIDRIMLSQAIPLSFIGRGVSI